MIDAETALHAAYETLLADLMLNGQAVVTYRLMANDKAVAPYVILGPWQGQGDNTKTSFGQAGEINLDVVTTSAGNARNMTTANAIAALITNRLKPSVDAEVLVLAAPLRTYATRIATTRTLALQVNGGFINRKILTVSHRIEQV